MIEKLIELRALPSDEEGLRLFLGEKDEIKRGFVALWCWKPVPKDARSTLDCEIRSGLHTCEPTPFEDTMLRCKGTPRLVDGLAIQLNEHLAIVT
jgi:hypothetical protein